MRDDKRFIPGSISAKIDASSEVLFPKELLTKPMNQLTQDELFKLMAYVLGLSTNPIDDPNNKAFMEFAADEQEKLGNNGSHLLPEDCDVDINDEGEINERDDDESDCPR